MKWSAHNREQHAVHYAQYDTLNMAVGVGPVSPVMAGPVISDVSVKGCETVYPGMCSKHINLCMLAGEAISGYFKSIFS